MWIAFSLLSSFLIAIVNWLDEYLTAKTPFVGENSLSKKVGSLLLISTLSSVVGVTWLFFSIDTIIAAPNIIALSVFSGIAFSALFAA